MRACKPQQSICTKTKQLFKNFLYCYNSFMYIVVVVRACKRGVQGYIVPGPGPMGARAVGAGKSSSFCVKFWYRTITL